MAGEDVINQFLGSSNPVESILEYISKHQAPTSARILAIFKVLPRGVLPPDPRFSDILPLGTKLVTVSSEPHRFDDILRALYITGEGDIYNTVTGFLSRSKRGKIIRIYNHLVTFYNDINAYINSYIQNKEFSLALREMREMADTHPFKKRLTKKLITCFRTLFLYRCFFDDGMQGGGKRPLRRRTVYKRRR